MPYSHPFVLKAVATDTNYNETEKQTLLEVSRQHGITIFDRLGVDESNGDRLLVLMDLPEIERLTLFRSTLAQITMEFNAVSTK